MECRVRNYEVRRRAGIERELLSRADQRLLRWFGHVERMDEYRMVRRVLIALRFQLFIAFTERKK